MNVNVNVNVYACIHTCMCIYIYMYIWYIHICVCMYVCICVCVYIYMYVSGGQTYLLLARDMVPCGCSPIGCEGFAFHAMCKHTVGKWVVLYRLSRCSHKIRHPKSIPYDFCLPLKLSVTHLFIYISRI